MLDWNIAGEMTGDREYIGRGFVPETRTLTDAEKEKIVWKQVAAPAPSPTILGRPGGVYGPEYTLRYLEYGDAPGKLPALPVSSPWAQTLDVPAGAERVP